MVMNRKKLQVPLTCWLGFLILATLLHRDTFAAQDNGLATNNVERNAGRCFACVVYILNKQMSRAIHSHPIQLCAFKTLTFNE